MAIRSTISITAADSRFFTNKITLYKYISPVALAGLIEHGDIKLTYRKDSNDPFECLPNGASSSENILEDIGFLSFTSNPRNHPMWGNYADKYRGACLEFCVDYFDIPSENSIPSNVGEELARLSKALKTINTEAFFYQCKKGNNPDFQGCETILKCEYVSDRSSPMNWSFTNNEVEFLNALQKWYRQITTKHKDWEYEDEYRVAMRRNRCTRFSVGPPVMYFTNIFTRYITKIILGPKCEYSPHEIDFLIFKKREQLKESIYIPREVKVVNARIQDLSFDLEIPEDYKMTSN